MKAQHLVPVFILALTLPGYVLAGSGASQKGSPVQKVAQKSSPCGCGATQKYAQKPPGTRCGFGSVQKGKGHVTAQKGTRIIQKFHGIIQKFHGSVQKSKGGSSTCCPSLIPAVVKGVGHILSATFACNTCGSSGKSKSGLLSSHHGSSKSKCYDSGRSFKVGPSGIPPNPFEDDELQPPRIPSPEADNRIERRPIHRQVIRTSATGPVLRSEPRTLSVSVAQPLTAAKPKPASVLRIVSAGSRWSLVPHNPLRAK